MEADPGEAAGKLVAAARLPSGSAGGKRRQDARPSGGRHAGLTRAPRAAAAVDGGEDTWRRRIGCGQRRTCPVAAGGARLGFGPEKFGGEHIFIARRR